MHRMNSILGSCLLLLCLGLFVCPGGASAQSSDSAAAPQPSAPSNVPSSQTPPSQTAPEIPPGNPAAPVSAPADIWTQNYLTGNWGGFRDELKNDGILLTPVLTAEVLGNPSGGARQGVITDGLLNTALDVDFGALTKGAVKDLIFHTEAEYIYGPGLSPQYVGDFSNTSNIAAFNTLRLDELWLSPKPQNPIVCFEMKIFVSKCNKIRKR